MFNEATLIGHLGADPEIRRTQDGRPVANLRLATSERWKDKSTGERKEKTEWHRIVCFSEGLCKIIEQYLNKGSKVMIRGKIATRKWTDQAGVEKYSTEIVMQGFDAKLIMLDGKAAGQEHSGDDPEPEFGMGTKGVDTRKTPPGRAGSTGKRDSDTRRSENRNADMDDEIPF
jgi:single-strand DNA-binding protein